jgi:hypothetical protein
MCRKSLVQFVGVKFDKHTLNTFSTVLSTGLIGRIVSLPGRQAVSFRLINNKSTPTYYLILYVRSTTVDTIQGFTREYSVATALLRSVHAFIVCLSLYSIGIGRTVCYYTFDPTSQALHTTVLHCTLIVSVE